MFLDSIKYLNPQKVEEETPREEESTPLESPSEGLRKGVIYLGKGAIYSDQEAAYQSLLDLPETTFPEKYRNTLTKAFLNATEIGQIQSLFKDWKKYKKNILLKISAFFSYIKENPEQCPLSKKYVAYVIRNLHPLSEETLQEGVVDLGFFKFWVLFKFYVQTKGN